MLVYPANVTGRALPADFSCTSGALTQHDDIVQCTSCGMVSSVPAIEQDEILQTYAEVVDHEYLAEEHGRRELFGWVLDSLGGYAVAGRQLLEIGSNVGLFLDVARERGWDAVGYEPSEWAVRFGKERFGVDLRRGALEELDVAPGSVDSVVMLDVLEHLVDPLGSLRRLGGVLAPDGLLTLSTVNVSSLHARVRKDSWPWLIRPHLHYFSPETLHAMLQAAGFRVVEWSVVPRSFHASYVANRLASSHGTLAGRPSRSHGSRTSAFPSAGSATSYSCTPGPPATAAEPTPPRPGPRMPWRFSTIAPATRNGTMFRRCRTSA